MALYDSKINHDIDGLVLLGNALVPDSTNITDAYYFCIQDMNSVGVMTCAKISSTFFSFEGDQKQETVLTTTKIFGS